MNDNLMTINERLRDEVAKTNTKTLHEYVICMEGYIKELQKKYKWRDLINVSEIYYIYAAELAKRNER